MTLHNLVDNDVIIKVCAYQFGAQFTSLATSGGVPPAMLGVGRFVVHRQLERGDRFANREQASARFAELRGVVQLVEPTSDELELAAEFEAKAIATNVELDVGESQLLAILLSRAGGALITGDKRAIAAIAKIDVGDVAGRVACFEQLIRTIAMMMDPDLIQAAICAEPNADKTMAICCSCASGRTLTKDALLDALKSYIGALRKAVGPTLLEGDDLFALAA
jgi:hypothetical protein